MIQHIAKYQDYKGTLQKSKMTTNLLRNGQTGSDVTENVTSRLHRGLRVTGGRSGSSRHAPVLTCLRLQPHAGAHTPGQGRAVSGFSHLLSIRCDVFLWP